VPENVVENLLILVAVVVLGLMIVGFSAAYFIPQEAFATSQQAASNIGASSTISVGPLLVSGGSGSLVVEVYNPSVTGNITLFAFPEPSYLQPSVGVLTPLNQPSFSVYMPNALPAKAVSVRGIYDLNGKLLYASSVQGYSVPFNVPVTINIQGVSGSNIVIVWVLLSSGTYNFRIGYTFTGVAS
jgi:hypothetical protein